MHAGITATDPVAVRRRSARWRSLRCRWSQRAQAHFAEADDDHGAAAAPRVRAPRIMSEAYRACWSGLIARGLAPPRAPVRCQRKHRLHDRCLRYAII